MRLTCQQIETIKQAVTDVFGSQARVKLFGSRVNDQARGGDIDLLIVCQNSIEKPVQLASKLAAKIYRACLGRKVDVVIDAPNIEKQSIHKIANETGVFL